MYSRLEQIKNKLFPPSQDGMELAWVWVCKGCPSCWDGTISSGKHYIKIEVVPGTQYGYTPRDQET